MDTTADDLPRRPGGQPARRRTGRGARPRPAVLAALGALVLAAATTAAPAAPASAQGVSPAPPSVAGQRAVPSPGACTTVGTARVGRAWLPQARVLVTAGPVAGVRAVGDHTRASVSGGLVEVQRTARRSASGTPVTGTAVVEVLLADGAGTVTCTVDLLGSAEAHGVRRLVRAH